MAFVSSRQSIRSSRILFLERRNLVCINRNKCWNDIQTKTRSSDSIRDIKYIQDDGLECLAKTDEKKAKFSATIF